MTKKISDEQLKEEIENGKTEKEIAYDYNYGYPSSALNRRLQKLGFEKNSKLTQQGSGGATHYIGKNLYRSLAEQKDLDPDDNRLFLKKESVGSGQVLFEITDKAFRQVEE